MKAIVTCLIMAGFCTITAFVPREIRHPTMRMANVAAVAAASTRDIENDPDAAYVAEFLSTMGAMDEENEYYSDDDDDDDENVDEKGEEKVNKPFPSNKKTSSSNKQQWDEKSPLAKSRLKKEAVDKKLANNKIESKADKKRRLMFFVKDAQRERKKASRIQRAIPFANRTSLSALTEGMEYSGTVISLTPFGAYVDVGTTVDGLLHISQMSRETFVQHPKDILAPGDAIVVTVASINPEKKKLHLSMLSKSDLDIERAMSAMPANNDNEIEEDDRILLSDLGVDDELWGQIIRVTNFGAYVNVGAVVQGFLHFMDHPLFGDGAHPSSFMTVGEKIRVWVADVDSEQQRVKLTANRPNHLPGPKRDLF